MSSRKVKKYLKAQQRARRRAQREQPPEAGTPTSPVRSSRVERAAPSVAMLAGLGIVAVVAGSAAMSGAAEPQAQPAVIEPYAVPGPAVAERLVCPRAPGRPEALSEQGVVEYAQRDDSVVASTTAVVFAATDGKFPAAQWIPLDDQGRGEPETLLAEGTRDAASDGPLADRPHITEEFDAEQGAPLVEVDPLPGRSPSRAPVTAAAYSYSADAGPVTGLTAGTCEAPARSQWFLGPETGDGANSLLTLTNPHSRDATAEVTTYDADGHTGALGTTTVLIPQHSVRTVNLAGLSETDSAIAVHVQASGAPVAGHLQSAGAVGAEGLGVEMLPTLPGPQQQHIAIGVPAGAEENPELWFYTPGEEEATVELQVFGADGQVETETPGVFNLEPDSVAVAGLHGLPTGTYDVVLNSDQPTFAAVRSAGDGEQITVEADPETDPVTGENVDDETEQEQEPIPDFSWAAAAEPLGAGSVGILAPGQVSALRVLNPAAEQPAQVSYRLLDSAGGRTEDLVIDVDAGTSAEVTYEELVESAQAADLEDLAAVVVADIEGEAYGGIVASSEVGGVTSAALVPAAPSAQHVPLRIEP
ncbi:DUF5719 family protein [Nesterenkonia sphaerica]|uniref:Uncharacterized protein n=1 Tax=Nesterenkonia sphaerica TaxID=1804988 RepID=A0A5R9ADT5_9MICC|nr:DUF5719 family protein [Nesterenkonia sphaerica]TLP76841.1 hypothetical protein FEF27_06215 [Nesterenkonia sphaerica]